MGIETVHVRRDLQASESDQGHRFELRRAGHGPFRQEPGKRLPLLHGLSIFDFDLIAVLRSAGCSLSEIREYMAHREPHAFVQLLRETEQKLLFEQRKLEKMRRTLQNGRNAAEAALAGKTGVPWLEELPQAFTSPPL